MYHLGARSNRKLVDVHPDLVRVVRRAILITSVDFTVLEGARTPKRQKILRAAGSSGVTVPPYARHLLQGWGHYSMAVDLGAWVDDCVDWSWPLYDRIALAMFTASRKEKVPIEWGGNWETLRDGPHFQLPILRYPA